MQNNVNSIREAAQKAINDLGIRLHELVLKEMRGERVSQRERRRLMSKRDEAHKALKGCNVSMA